MCCDPRGLAKIKYKKVYNSNFSVSQTITCTICEIIRINNYLSFVCKYISTSYIDVCLFITEKHIREAKLVRTLS